MDPIEMPKPTPQKNVRTLLSPKVELVYSLTFIRLKKLY
jgi:hypothetical protein